MMDEDDGSQITDNQSGESVDAGMIDGAGNEGDSTELDSADVCPIGALYDQEDDSCYVECIDITEEQCDALEEEVFGDFDEFLIDNYSSSGSGEAFTVKAKYQINSNLSLTTLEINESDAQTRYQEIWNSAIGLLPRSNVEQAFSEFHIDSDGESETLAYVTMDDNQPGKWIIAFDDVDYVGARDKEFIHTTIHEFGHVVFLAANQLDTNDLGSCPNYHIEEGCSFENSYINQFFQQFWSDIFDEHDGISSDDDQMDFYETYQDRFVSEYAATNPVEDAAEVFTHFVLREKPATSNSIVDQKILMMYDAEALVALRNAIRGKLTVTRARLQDKK